MSQVQIQEVSAESAPAHRQGDYNSKMVAAFLPYASVLKQQYGINILAKKYHQ